MSYEQFLAKWKEWQNNYFDGKSSLTTDKFIELDSKINNYNDNIQDFQNFEMEEEIYKIINQIQNYKPNTKL